MSFTFDEDILSDLHKDAYGFRPRAYFWREWQSSSNEEKQAIWDNLLVELEAELERERRAKAESLSAYEKQIADNIALGAEDRRQAIKWLIQGLNLSDYDLAYGGSYICYELGLDYSLAAEFDEICKEFLDGRNPYLDKAA